MGTSTLISRHDKNLLRWADTRETSIEIAQAIFLKAEGNVSKARNLWEQPTEDEKREITNLAFRIQDLDFPDPELQDICFYWGGYKVWREGY